MITQDSVVNNTLKCAYCHRPVESNNELINITLNDVVFPLCQHCFERYMVTCASCGSIHKRIVYNHTKDFTWYCADCAEKAGLTACHICGTLNPTDEMCEHQGGWYCDECFDEHFSTCDECGDITYNDNLSRTVQDTHVCIACTRSSYHQCFECGLLVHVDEAEADYNNDYLCPSCAQEYFICDICEEWTSSRERYDFRNYACCESCYDRKSAEIIRAYHDNPDRQFHATIAQCKSAQKSGKPIRYFGIELEIDNHKDGESVTADNITCATAILATVNDGNPEQYFYAMHDSSLSEDGIEIISQPMTREFFVLKKAKQVKEMFKIAREYGYFGHDTYTCGLHFHVSRNSLTEETIDNMGLILEQFWRIVQRLSRRSADNLAKWACRYNVDMSLPPTEKINGVKKAMRDSVRHSCLNTHNSATVELRIFRSTLNYNTFIGCWDFFRFLIEFAETHTPEQITETTTNDFLSAMKAFSEPLAEYLTARGFTVN